MAKSDYKSLLHQAQLTQLLVKIQDDIERLKKISQVKYAAKDFEDILNKYISSGRTLSDYLTLRKQALEIKNDSIRHQNRPDVKQIICNIVLGIVGLAVIYGLAVGINYLVNDKILFFKPETIKRIEAVCDDVDALKHNAFAAVI